MTDLRDIEPISENAGKRLRRNPIAPPPKIAWLALDQLVVDGGYQRALSAKGVALIRRLVESWDWNCFKPLSVAAVGDGRYEVIDGQHTAIAAATHGAIETLPCLVLDAATRAQRSRAFVGINMDRLPMTAYALFRAKVAAEDPTACAAQAALEASGATLLNTLNSRVDPNVGDLTSPSSLLIIVRAAGGEVLTRVLKICIAAQLAPIPSAALKGVADLVVERSMSDAEIIAGLSEIDAETLMEEVHARLKRGTSLSGPAAVIAIIQHNAKALKAA